MTTLLRTLAICLGLSLPFVTFGQTFNFLYHLEGERPTLHAAVFDDGKKTYFQYSGPVNFSLFTRAGEDAKEAPLEWHFEAPYIIIDQVLNCFYLRAETSVLGVFNESLVRTTCVHYPRSKDDPIPGAEDRPAQKTFGDLRDSPVPIAARPIVFAIKKGDSLSEALRQFLLSQGYLLNWLSPDDFVIRESYVNYGNSVEDIVHTLERDYRLKIELNFNRVTVRVPFAHQ